MATDLLVNSKLRCYGYWPVSKLKVRAGGEHIEHVGITARDTNMLLWLLTC